MFADGIQADPKKIEAIKQFPVPTDLKSLRSFLGLASYYSRFIQDFSKTANPLFALTRKDVPFIWSPACKAAFEELKKRLVEAPVLVFPNFGRGFVLETDTSGLGLGAVLAQEQEDATTRPIAYASRTLQQHEKNYGSTELEGLGVVLVVKHCRPYLYGHHCDVYTDHLKRFSASQQDADVLPIQTRKCYSGRFTTWSKRAISHNEFLLDTTC